MRPSRLVRTGGTRLSHAGTEVAPRDERSVRVSQSGASRQPLADLNARPQRAEDYLRKTPAFKTVAVLTIAIGVGATTVMFRVVYNVLVDPLPLSRLQRHAFTLKSL